MLSDLTKVHTGYLFTPRVTLTTEDENWGKPGFSKKVFTAPSLLRKGGWASNDKVLERVENKHWVIEVSNFQTWMLGFTKFVGKWETTQIAPNKIEVNYEYDLHANIAAFYPVNWIFAKVFWKLYMNRVLKNIKTMIANKEPYLFE